MFLGLWLWSSVDVRALVCVCVVYLRKPDGVQFFRSAFILFCCQNVYKQCSPIAHRVYINEYVCRSICLALIKVS